MSERTFELKSKYVNNQRKASIFFLILTLTGIAFTVSQFTFYSYSKKYLISISVIISFIFGLLAWLFGKISQKSQQYSISVNEEGVWPAYKNKNESLIKWEDIYEIKESYSLNAWYLLDHSKNTLMKISYFMMSGFDELRIILIEKTKLNTTLPLQFTKKNISLMIILLVLIDTFIIFGNYLLHRNLITTFIILLFISILSVYLYLKDGWRIKLMSDSIQILYPFKKIYLKPDDIKEITIYDQSYQNQLIPGIEILLKNSQNSFKIERFDISTIHLFQILKYHYS